MNCDPTFDQQELDALIERARRELETVTELAQRAHAVNAPSFARAALDRLAAGAKEYGKRYLLSTRDNVAEALEEPGDIFNYPFLELLRLEAKGMRDEDWQELRMLAIDASAFAAGAFDRLLRFREKRDDLER